MSKLLFDINGDLYRATAYELVSEEDLERELAEAQSEMDRVNEAKAFSNRLQAAVGDGSAPAPAPEAPQPAPAPEVPAAPMVPEQPAAPAEQPSQEVPQQAIDPATAPAPVAPIVLN